MSYIYTSEQYSLLEGLAYRIADSAYMAERYGEDASAEQEQNRKTLAGLFEQLDALAVPFWVQNSVIAFAEDWRRYKSQYLNSYLNSRNIKAA